jgi:hypothetical protein
MADDDRSACESCGDLAPVVAVRRMWVTPPAWDAEGSVREGELERWCTACRLHYPHRVVDDPA